MNQQEMELAFRSALPLIDVDQMISPDYGFVLAWMNIVDRPDLGVLSQQEPSLKEGFAICTLFYANPGQKNMQIGLRIQMRQPVTFNLSLVFPVKMYFQQLQIVAQYGNLWIVPGPVPSDLVGSIAMTMRQFSERVMDRVGQGLFVTLDDDLKRELKGQLDVYQQSNRI